MFILLRQLASIRRTAALARPDYPRSLAILDVVASPRHADILLVTGPVTTRMASALRTAYDAMPEPRLVAALGNCALGRNIIGAHATHAGGIETVLPVHIRIPGWTPTPAAIAEHLLAGIAAIS